MSGKLTLLVTPIGNLEDISIRALKELKDCDFIVAEDTRVSRKLLEHFGIKKPLTSYHEHNKDAKGRKILKRICNGENCVLVTDAGMPAISDPGEDMVKLCHEYGIKLTIIPGACAAVCALAVSGLDTSEFVFVGFISVNKNKRTKKLEDLINEKRTMIFYEAPHKLLRTLNDMKTILGDRNITIVRELTKIHEEISRTTLCKAIEKYSDNNKPKGEFVIVVEGNKGTESQLPVSIEECVKMVKDIIDNDKVSLSEASKRVSEITGIGKRKIYNEYVKQ